MLPEDEQVKQYDKLGNTPLAWEASADDLETSAAILKRSRYNSDPNEIKVLFPELMLRALSLECLLKALWLRQGNKIAENGQYLGVKGAADHDLLQLADVVGLQLNDNKRDVLNRLSKIMTSSGRYPIPKDWSLKRIQRLQGGGKGAPGYWRYPSDDQALSQIVTDVKSKLGQ